MEANDNRTALQAVKKSGEYTAVPWRQHSGPDLLNLVRSILGPQREALADEVSRNIANELLARLQNAKDYGKTAAEAWTPLSSSEVSAETRKILEGSFESEQLRVLIGEFLR